MIFIYMEEKQTRYAENARKAQKAFYYRNKQKRDDDKMAKLLSDLLEPELEEKMKLWPKTFAVIERINK